MNKLFRISLIQLLLINFMPFSFAQQNSFSSNNEALILKGVENVLYLLEDNLNTLGDTTLKLEEKEIIIQDMFDLVFQNEKTLLYNNLYNKSGSTTVESDHLPAERYLGNIVTFFKKGIGFEFRDPKISKVLFDCERYVRLVKVTFYQSITGIRIEEPFVKKDIYLDAYFVFNGDSVNDLSQPRISAIDMHQDNEEEFTPIFTEEDNTAQINSVLDSLNALISESHMSNAIFIKINRAQVSCLPKIIWLESDNPSYGTDLFKFSVKALIKSTARIKERSVYVNNDRVTSTNLNLTKTDVNQVNGLFYKELIEVEIEVRRGTNVITIEVTDENDNKVSESIEIIA